MKRNLLLAIGAIALHVQAAPVYSPDVSDSDSTQVYFFAPNEKAGFRVAVPQDDHYVELGQLFSSDYGPWGAEKKMYAPSMVRLADGRVVVVFQLNDYAPCFGITCSDDLYTWRPQDYPRMSEAGCIEPLVCANAKGGVTVYFKTRDGRVRKTESDAAIRHFSKDVSALEETYDRLATAEQFLLGDKNMKGLGLKVANRQLDDLRRYMTKQAKRYESWRENLGEDAQRLLPQLPATAEAHLQIHADRSKAISDKLIGVFFEDISYAADGGLYAEMVQNRDFEYTSADRNEWNSSTAWTVGQGRTMQIATEQPLSKNNPHYAILQNDTLWNEGWDGMVVNKGANYLFSIYVNNLDGKKQNMTVELLAEGKVVGSAPLTLSKKNGWLQLTAKICATDNATQAKLRLRLTGKGRVAVDMVSLFPEDTFRGRTNGLRKDLAQAIADLKPKFIRFPGGCMSHGDGLENIYHWHHTVGPLQDRVPDRNIWHYHQTRGLGFFEYFQYCEDIGAEPLPVLAAGVPCQNSKADASGYAGQQGGIPMKDMPEYVQEFLHLIEWANGDPNTNEWARMRAEAGHPEPFHLKYIGIGNEDLISTDFEERCLMIAKAIRERYPDIIICGTVGPFHEPSSDYVEGWRFANEHRDVFDMVDEHYYESVGWFLNNQDYYDSYDRNAAKVYLGEYAARQGKGGLDCALAEAVHLCNIERNADVVTMTSYAPLLSKNGHSNWSPDMMYFSNTHIEKTPSYETQRIFSHYAGDRYIESSLQADSIVKHRVAASVVKDSKTGETVLKVVNVLPVPLRLTLSATLTGTRQKLHYEGFSGKPGDRKVEVEKGSYEVHQDDAITITLPPYSLRAVSL